MKPVRPRRMAVEDPDEADVKQLRGSSLLLTGRVVSRAINAGTQILLARTLTKTDYGAFAYAFAFIALSETFVTLGLNRAITRYVPVYEERGEHGKAVGTILLVLGTIVSLGIAIVVLVNGLSGSIQQSLIHDRRTVSLLAILIALVPLEALDHMADGIMAVLGRPGAIFVRRHVLGPCLRLAVVSVLVVQHADARVLAFGYIAVGVLGLLVYSGMLVRGVQRQILPRGVTWRSIQLPFREIATFVGPLLVTAIVRMLIESSDALVLGAIHGPEGVASLRAVLPVARFVLTFQLAFMLMFTTLAARLYARDATAALNDSYWRTATWIALLSFPVFAVSFVFAGPLTATLYGPRYADSAPIMAILSLGYFVNGITGLNAQVLGVFRRLTFLTVVHLVVLVVTVAGLFAVVPTFDALGAAVVKSGSIIFINVLLQLGLRGTGVRFFDVRFSRIYVLMGAALLGLWVLQTTVTPPFAVAVALTGVVWLLLLRASRSTLRIEQVFPELRRIPLVRFFVGDPPPRVR